MEGTRSSTERGPFTSSFVLSLSLASSNMDDMVDRPDSCIIYGEGVKREDDSNANGRPETSSSILRGVGVRVTRYKTAEDKSLGTPS